LRCASFGLDWSGKTWRVTEDRWPYRVVADDLREKINSGKIRGKLPPRTALAEEYGVTHMTVARALDVLKDEGLIYGVAGLGVFVK
jgi:GntR family transcriptional regulator